MRDAIKVFTRGELVALSSGEYSDYRVDGLFKVLKDFDAQILLVEWAEETGRKLEKGVVEIDYLNENIKFIGWLNKKGYIEHMDYRELHTGSYGKTHLSDFSEACEGGLL